MSGTVKGMGKGIGKGRDKGRGNCLIAALWFVLLS